MAVDVADVGNLVLGIAGTIDVYLVSVGLYKEAGLVMGIAIAIKAFCSAVDNYKFKKTIPQ